MGGVTRSAERTHQGRCLVRRGRIPQAAAECVLASPSGGEVYVWKRRHPVIQKGDREPSPRLLCHVCGLETSHLGRPPHPAGQERAGLHRGPRFSNGWKGPLHFSNIILQKPPQVSRSPRGKPRRSLCTVRAPSVGDTLRDASGCLTPRRSRTLAQRPLLCLWSDHVYVGHRMPPTDCTERT